MTMQLLTSNAWDKRITIFRADEDEAGEIVDAFALVTQDYVVFIDTLSTPALARAMIAAMHEPLATRQPLVINTHADYDHCWGNAAFAVDGILPAPIYGHALAATRMESTERHQFLRHMQQHNPIFDEVRLIAPTRLITTQATLNCGNISLVLLPTPGHRPDHLAVWLPDIRHLIAGDAAGSPFPYVPEASDLPLLVDSLRQLDALQAQVVLPCHGSTTDGDLIGRNLRYFSTIQERCQHAIETNTLPADWAEREQLAEVIAMPYDEALTIAEVARTDTPDMYEELHEIAIKATLVVLHEERKASFYP
jgi:glyoxylase-like metal-dependent hydrolase (beta-lactamase superfamily II)